MTSKITRRTVLATGGAAIATAAVGVVPTVAGCKSDHKKMGYRLGALLVDPSLDQAGWDKMVAEAKCPTCKISIKPSGLSFSEHMPG